MTTNLKNFLMLASENEELFTKLQELNDIKEKELVYTKTIAIAKEVDIELTMSDFDESDAELSDDELASVAGGWTTCECAVQGQGRADADGEFCSCDLGGTGYEVSDRWHAHPRCKCTICGYGHEF